MAEPWRKSEVRTRVPFISFDIKPPQPLAEFVVECGMIFGLSAASPPLSATTIPRYDPLMTNCLTLDHLDCDCICFLPDCA